MTPSTATASPPTRLGAHVRHRMVHTLTQTLSEAKAVFALTLHGVPVPDVDGLRRALRTASAELTIVKHALARRALTQAGWAALTPSLEGTSGLGLTRADPVAVSKVLVTFANEHAGVTVRGAVVEGHCLTREGIQALAALPSRAVLRAHLVGQLQAPLRGLVGVLRGIPRALVTVIDASRHTRPHTAERNAP